MKNPTLFARQANIAGQQIVNNGSINPTLRARERQSAPNEVLEACGPRVDGRAARNTGDGDQTLAAVGTLDRPADGCRESAVRAQRLPRWAPAIDASTRQTAKAARRR
jgi:hypothetical protein